MGLHDLGAQMRPHLQELIYAADDGGYDAIVLGYALCGRGTEVLRAGKTQLVLPRAHGLHRVADGQPSALRGLLSGSAK